MVSSALVTSETTLGLSWNFLLSFTCEEMDRLSKLLLIIFQENRYIYIYNWDAFYLANTPCHCSLCDDVAIMVASLLSISIPLISFMSNCLNI